MGHLSPLDGIGPKEVGLDLLQKHFKENNITEIILALSQTVEGEATAHYISELAKPFNIKLTRLAQGIPIGGELAYIDGHTLLNAFRDRKIF